MKGRGEKRTGDGVKSASECVEIVKVRTNPTRRDLFDRLRAGQGLGNPIKVNQGESNLIKVTRSRGTEKSRDLPGRVYEKAKRLGNWWRLV